MAATAKQARLKFKSWAGLKEGAAVDKAIISPWNKKTGRHCKSKTTPWCAIAVSSCLLQIGVKTLSTSAACTTQLKWYKAHKHFRKRGSKPQVSDIVFYNFKNGKTTISTHVGLVTSVEYKKKGYIYVIEGNKDNKVGYRHISYKSKNIVGFGVPYYKK